MKSTKLQTLGGDTRARKRRIPCQSKLEEDRLYTESCVKGTSFAVHLPSFSSTIGLVRD